MASLFPHTKTQNFHVLSSSFTTLLHPSSDSSSSSSCSLCKSQGNNLINIFLGKRVASWVVKRHPRILKQRGSFVGWLTKEAYYSIMEKGNNSHSHNHSYNKQQAGAPTSSSSSFTTDLFGPKDRSKSSASSAGLFVSVFGPSSMGRESSQSGVTGSSRMQNLGGQYSNAKYGTSDHETQRGWDSKDKSSVYHTESSEPCYFSSSIYYGGQDIYLPPTQTTSSQHTFKKDGGEDDQNGNNSNCASRGNWWQGSLYY